MERFDHLVKFHTWFKHWHRYHFIKTMLSGARVCDIAWGEGHGSHFLAEYASNVTGIDVDVGTIFEAGKKCRRESLEYLKGDATAIMLEDKSERGQVMAIEGWLETNCISSSQFSVTCVSELSNTSSLLPSDMAQLTFFK